MEFVSSCIFMFSGNVFFFWDWRGPNTSDLSCPLVLDQTSRLLLWKSVPLKLDPERITKKFRSILLLWTLKKRLLVIVNDSFLIEIICLSFCWKEFVCLGEWRQKDYILMDFLNVKKIVVWTKAAFCTKFKSTLTQFVLFRKNYDTQYWGWQESKVYSKDTEKILLGFLPRQTPVAPGSKWQPLPNHRFLCPGLWAVGECRAAA